MKRVAFFTIDRSIFPKGIYISIFDGDSYSHVAQTEKPNGMR